MPNTKIDLKEAKMNPLCLRHATKLMGNHQQPTLFLRGIVSALKNAAYNRKEMAAAHDAVILGRMAAAKVSHYLTDPWISTFRVKEIFK